VDAREGWRYKSKNWTQMSGRMVLISRGSAVKYIREHHKVLRKLDRGRDSTLDFRMTIVWRNPTQKDTAALHLIYHVNYNTNNAEEKMADILTLT